ncbi:cytochrome P450 [Cyathus striatus]|nr:cytochrome P450 [Cyathus striatus]
MMDIIQFPVTNFIFLAIEICVVCTVIYNYRTRRNSIAPLPPGPKGLPFVGNIADLPKSKPWVTFSKWGDTYGGMVYVNVFGKSVIILNDPAIAVDLLDKKGKLYSDRPTFVMAGDLVGWNETIGLKHYDRNGPWSEGRRYLAQYMGSRGKVDDAFSDILQSGAHNFLKKLLENPMDCSLNIGMYAASNVLLLAYGYKVEREDDPLLAIVANAMDEFSELTLSGAYLVDVIPILRHIPDWFPGAGWKQKIPICRDDRNKMLDIPFEWSQQQLNDGFKKLGFVHATLANNDGLTPQQIHQIKTTASDIYGGGSDTTLAGVQSFFLAMVLFPSAQAKAQSEIDAVIGSERLPTLEDRANLPYVEALYWEVLRFYPFVPLSIPHVVREDDVHNGYLIPKGTTIVPNVWRFMKDPDKYNSPEKFSPERFLSANGHSPDEDPRNYIFGFGRRICPGRHLGDASMWIAMASVLAAFSLSPTIIEGKPVAPNPKYHEGTIVHPESFECNIKSRSSIIESLLRLS